MSGTIPPTTENRDYRLDEDRRERIRREFRNAHLAQMVTANRPPRSGMLSELDVHKLGDDLRYAAHWLKWLLSGGDGIRQRTMSHH